MTAQIIDGKALAKSLRIKFRERVNALRANGVQPGLAVILVEKIPRPRFMSATRSRPVRIAASPPSITPCTLKRARPK